LKNGVIAVLFEKSGQGRCLNVQTLMAERSLDQFEGSEKGIDHKAQKTTNMFWRP